MVRSIHTMGATFTGDVYEGDVDGSNCVTPAVWPANLDLYELGAEVPLTDFVKLTVETRSGGTSEVATAASKRGG